MISQKDLSELARYEVQEYPVTSLYLNVNSESIKPKTYITNLKDLIKIKRNKSYFSRLTISRRKSVEMDFKRLQKFISEEYDDRDKRGIAVFTCYKKGLWKVFYLPVPVGNELIVNHNPYIKPLSSILSEYRNYAVVLVDRAKARIFEVKMNRFEDYFHIVDDVPDQVKESGWGGYKERRIERHIMQHVTDHLKKVGTKLMELFKEREFNWLIIGGRREIISTFENLLHSYLKERIIGRIVVEPDAPIEDVFEKVRKLEIEARIIYERRLVKNLIDRVHDSRKAVDGILACLNFLYQGQVDTLVIKKGYGKKGVSCIKCGYLGLEISDRCPICGSNSLEKVPDVVDEAITLAYRQGCKVEHVTVNMSSLANIAAFLRYSIA
ncbi:MAG: hypothetical protein ACE5QV_02615 [Fidelibacterota bacterium]